VIFTNPRPSPGDTSVHHLDGIGRCDLDLGAALLQEQYHVANAQTAPAKAVAAADARIRAAPLAVGKSA